MEHTPGRWNFENGADAYLVGTDIKAIGRVYYTADDTGEANARLIAAAPDLLAACEQLRDYVVDEVFASGGESIPQVKQANAAIARAKGGE